MNRSGYSEDYGDDDPLAMGRWQGAVRSAMKGKRGQAFLRDLLVALQALPEKKLIAGNMEREEMRSISSWGLFPVDCVCAIGAVGKVRGVDMTEIDRLICEEEEEEGSWGSAIGDTVAHEFNIAGALAREIMFENDEGGAYNETPERRYARMVRWVEARLRHPGDCV